MKLYEILFRGSIYIQWMPTKVFHICFIRVIFRFIVFFLRQGFQLAGPEFREFRILCISFDGKKSEHNNYYEFIRAIHLFPVLASQSNTRPGLKPSKGVNKVYN